MCDPIDGYFDDGTNNAVARPCFYTCKTCPHGHSCDSCDSTINHRFLNPITMNCDPLNGYYDDGTNNPVAQICHYSCKTCVNGITCTACDSSHFRVYNSATQLCDAIPGYFDDGVNSISSKCLYSCLTCSDGTTCDSCDLTTSHRVLNSMKLMCNAIDGYYDDGLGNSNAVLCHYTCRTCNTYPMCISCDLNIDHRILNFSTMACDPVEGYFDNGAGNRITDPCFYTCKTCNSFLQCLSCDEINNHRVLDPINHMCDPIDGYYDDGTNNPISQKCVPWCKTCSHTSLECTSCFDEY
jgi:proprotein convertase subtilisin/kexin type 5